MAGGPSVARPIAAKAVRKLPIRGAPWIAPSGATGAWDDLAEQSSFTRLWRVFMVSRVAIAAVLVVLQASMYALGSVTQHTGMVVCAAYLAATLAARFWARPRPSGSSVDGQWLFTVGIDVLVFSYLNFLQASGINYTPLLALPVLLSSILGPVLLAFGTAAVVTLLLLGDAWWMSLTQYADFSARFLQAGLSGSGFFLIALLAHQLALRLAREEHRAETGQSAAQMQIRVNELVIETLSDGVLIVDAQALVHSANPAARRWLAADELGRQVPFHLSSEPAWASLAELAGRTFTMHAPQKSDISLDYASHNPRRLHVRTRLATPHSSKGESLCVVFLEDLREMEARVRTEKMAAMGRMSAAVAHEIRNPLAAITQANALLEEDLTEPTQRQLTNMVAQNARRLARIVDEVLDISRARLPDPAEQAPVLPLDVTSQRIAADWSQQNRACTRLRIHTNASEAHVAFDGEHLRRVMVNLLDNALRYASTADRAIQVSTHRLSHQEVQLAVWSDGPPLEHSVQTHLFEPFFSSESRSSGLGLYICRELCERYGAQIAYQRVARDNIDGNEFFVILRSCDGTPHPQLSLDGPHV